ncbi:MAG: ClC family H(+)/Cl(-) exchange transporter [Treponema sp.]|jgi:H+/Cl- antiporter ClcA|nr:ClC family H(+)/Cl(-) exchange transporter [Treponema sp.]
MLGVQPRFPPLIRKWYGSRLAVVLESILIGFIAGFVIAGFRLFLGQADILRSRLYHALPLLPWYWTFSWTAALVLAGLFLGWAAKIRPMIRGSGIPQIKGALHGKMALNPAAELPLKLVAGMLGLGAGLSLGREGPSIQMGAYVGQGVLSVFHRPYRDRKYLVTAASAAGVAAAFNAPLAGVLFAIEELQPSFSPMYLACTMGSAMAADTAAGIFFGMRPVFDFRYVQVLPLKLFFWVLLLGFTCSLLGECFKRSLYLSLDLYDRLGIPLILRPLLPLLVSVPLGLFFFDVTGGGHGLIESLSDQDRALGTILLLLGGKVLFTGLCYGSGTAGGIFLPLLACGALSGAGLGGLLVKGGIITGAQMLNFMILGMAAFFTAVVKAPVTGVVLILEMSGNFNHLGSLVLVCLVSFVTSELMASRPVYAVLLERMSGAGRLRPVPARSRPPAAAPPDGN